jgi:hypothetical protein
LGLSVKDIRPLVGPCLFFVIFAFFALMISISSLFFAKGENGVFLFFFQRFPLLLFYWKEKTIPQHAMRFSRVSDGLSRGGSPSELE